MRLIGRGNKAKPTPITAIPPKAAERSGNRFSGAVAAHKLFNDHEVDTKLTEKATGWITSWLSAPAVEWDRGAGLRT